MIDQLLIMIEQIALHIPLMLGAYISFSLLKVPDLSLESAYVTGALTGACVIPMIQTLPWIAQLIIVIMVSIMAGGCVGMVSSLLTQKAGFSHLLSSILTIGIFYGINQLIAGSYLSLSRYANPLIVAWIPKHPELVLLGFIGIALLLLIYFLLRTQIGYCFAVYGNNSHFFKHYGISSCYVFMMGIILANMMAGLSGYFFAQSNGFAEINMAFGKALLCITALILGKTCMPSHKPLNVALPIVGLCLYFMLQQLLLKVGFNLKYFTAVQAVVVLLLLILFQDQRSTTSDSLGV